MALGTAPNTACFSLGRASSLTIAVTTPQTKSRAGSPPHTRIPYRPGYRSGLVFDYTPQLGTHLADAFSSSGAVQRARSKHRSLQADTGCDQKSSDNPAIGHRPLEFNAVHSGNSHQRHQKHQDQRTPHFAASSRSFEPIKSAVGAGHNMHRKCAGKAKNLLEPRQTNEKQFDRETRKKHSEQPIAAIKPFWGKPHYSVPKSWTTGRPNSVLVN